LVALAGMALLAACGGGGSSGSTPPRPIAAPTGNGHVDWTMFGYDATRSGKNPNETVLGRNNVASLHLHWTFQTSGTIVAQPVVAANVTLSSGLADIVYVADEAGNVYAINAANGATIWTQAFGASQNACADLPQWGITSTPAIDRTRGALYVVDGRGSAHALNLATGTPLASWPGPVAVLPDASVEYAYSGLALSSAGSLYATSAGYCDSGTYFGSIVALNATTGAQTATWVPQTLPNYGNGMWGTGGVAVDPRPGVTDVYVTTGNAFPESALYSDSVVRLTSALVPVASNSQYSAAVPNDDDFGASPVTFAAPGCPPQLAAEQKNGQLDLYDLDTIAAGPVQRVAVGAATILGLNVNSASYDTTANMLYIANATANAPYGQGLLAFSFVNCALVLAWQRAGGATSPLSQPVIANGVVYYATGSGKTVAAYDAVTGAPLWTSATFGAPSYTAPTVVNASLYAVSFDKHVYAYGL
jgi:outer membrane protein assembly factor BamB